MNAKNCAKRTYNTYYVTLLGVVFGVSVGNNSLLFYSNQYFILRIYYIKQAMCCVSVSRQKLHLAVESGTKQKTVAFEARENWILGCGELQRLKI